MKNNKWFIIDFDSTFTQVEAMEELAAISLKNDPDKDEIVDKIRQLTDKAMEGKMPFHLSLRARIALLSAKKYHIQMLVNRLRKKVSPSFIRNKAFFKEYKGRILIVSGGFKEFIVPIVKSYNIDESCVYANTFQYDAKNFIIGCDINNPLSQDGGKVKLLKKLRLKGDVHVIGDGYTDYQIREAGLAQKFFAYTENVYRQSVADKADHIAPSLDEILYAYELPMSLSYPKNRIQVVLASPECYSAESFFKKEGYQIIKPKDGVKKIPILKNQPAILIQSATDNLELNLSINANWIAAGIWGENIQTKLYNQATQNGIAIFHTPLANVRTAAEWIILQMLQLNKSPFNSNEMHNEIRNKTLGIIGYGNCGSTLSILAQGLGMDVIFYDLFDKTPLGNATMARDLSELLRKSDVVVNTSSRNALGSKILDEKTLKQMKATASLIQMSYDDTIDLSIVKELLKQQKIKSFAIDCQWKNTYDIVSKFPRTIATLNQRNHSFETQQSIARMLSEKIIQYINQGNTLHCINIPNIQLPEPIGTHRFIHIHENKPGMMARINQILAYHKINIVSQHLQTNTHTGYVITDVERAYSIEVVNELKAIPGTIRFRVLY